MPNNYMNHAQTAIRLQLLRNGYTPIASAGKAGMPKNWQNLVVNETLIQKWDRERGFTAAAGERATTSVRIDGELFVIDVDVRHAAASAAVLAMLWDEAPDFMGGCLMRDSGATKVALFGRINMPKLKGRHTASFVNPDHPDEGERVEFFGAGSGRHFVCYGPYIDKRGEVVPERAYRFDADGGDMLSVPLDDLPFFPAEKLGDVIDACERILSAHMKKVEGTKKGVDAQAQLYDLKPDMKWKLASGETITLEQAETAALAAGRTGEEMRGFANLWDEASRTPGRVKAVIGFTGLVLIDFKTGCSHRWEAKKPPEFATEEIGKALAGLREQQRKADEELREETLHARENPALDWPESEPGLPPDATFDEAVSWALVRYGSHGSDGQVIDLYATSDETAKFKPDGLRARLKRYSQYMEGPRGGTVEENAYNFWYANPERLTIDKIRLAPGRAFPIYRDGPELVKNIYRPVEHSGSGEADTFLAFMAHLLPDERERDYFLNWLAFKWRNPHVPGCAVIFVAFDDETGSTVYGAGRGTLFAIIERLFTPAYVSHQDFSILTGTSSQAAYDDWLAASLIVTVNEAKTDINDTRYAARSAAYERLKEIADPAPRSRTLNRKGEKRVTAMVHASILIATNHPDAIMIPEGDRRFSVLSNGAALPDVGPILRWMAKDGNIAELARWLSDRDIAGFDSAKPLETLRKKHLAQMASSDIDEAFKEARRCFTTLFTKEQLRAFVLADVGSDGGRGDIDKQFGVVFRRATSLLRDDKGDKVRVVMTNGKRESVFHFGSRLSKNGPDVTKQAMVRAEVLVNDKLLAPGGLSALRVLQGGKKNDENDDDE